ncbi:MAG: hypothetical protein R3F43_30035 [bacterium]
MSDLEEPPRGGRPVEALVYGVNAALAVATHRPDAIHRVLYDEPAARPRPAPQGRRGTAPALPGVPTADLVRVARGQHHEGVVVVTDPLPAIELPAFLAQLKRDAVFLALDGVGSPTTSAPSCAARPGSAPPGCCSPSAASA